MKRVLLLVITVALVTAVGLQVFWLRQVPEQATRLIAARRLKEAQQELENYLRWFSSDAKARLLLAEAYGRDESKTAPGNALHHLHLISSESDVGADARFREGQLQFLLRHRPATAERLLRESIKLDPDKPDTNLLLWRLLSVTGRHPMSAQFFWKAYNFTVPDKRGLLLRDWYLSEFSPGAGNAELDRHWGILGETEPPTPETELHRYQLFMKDEPESVLGYAAAAQYCIRNRELELAADSLTKGSQLSDAATEPLYFAATIGLALEQGEFDKAVELLKRWPEPREGYEFFRDQGTILDEVQKDYPAAIQAYRAAIHAETGDAEWTTQNRLAHCLRKVGKNEEAAAVLRQAKVAELLMEPGVHQPIREALAGLNSSRGLQSLLDLYQALGRRREVDGWRYVITQSAKTSGQSVPKIR